MTVASLLGIMAFVVGVPAVWAMLTMFPQHRRLFLALMAFTTCYVKKPLYQEVFFVNYRGVDRGFAVTLPDLFFFAFFLQLLTGQARHRIQWVPFNTLPWVGLTLISCASLVGSIEPFYGLFTIHKFLRCLVFYIVVVNCVRDRRDVIAVMTALAAALVFQGFTVIWAKYITKAVVSRSIGTFRHPNTLAMYTDLILPILVGMFLTTSISVRLRRLFAVAIVLGIICVLFTKSRAAMLLLPVSLGGVTAVSILMKPTGRKFLVLGVGTVVVAAIVLAALPKLIARFQNAPKESAETREYFNAAAEAMARDNLLGIGINLYSHSLAKTDYYWYVYPDKLDVNDPEAFRESTQGQSRLGTAHHIYWLYAAETGYIGLAFFLLHCALFYGCNVWYFLTEKDHLFRSILLGMLVGTSIHHLHGTLEWIFRQTEVQYLYFLLMGLMIAMRRIRREEVARAAAVRPAISVVASGPSGPG